MRSTTGSRSPDAAIWRDNNGFFVAPRCFQQVACSIPTVQIAGKERAKKPLLSRQISPRPVILSQSLIA